MELSTRTLMVVVVMVVEMTGIHRDKVPLMPNRSRPVVWTPCACKDDHPQIYDKNPSQHLYARVECRRRNILRQAWGQGAVDRWAVVVTGAMITGRRHRDNHNSTRRFHNSSNMRVAGKE